MMGGWDGFKRDHGGDGSKRASSLEDGQILAMKAQTPETLTLEMRKNQWGKPFAVLPAILKTHSGNVIVRLSMTIQQITNLIDLGAFEPYEDGKTFGPAVEAFRFVNDYGKTLVRFRLVSNV